MGNEAKLEQESENNTQNSFEAPDHLKGLQVLANGYQYYMAYLKEGGDDGISAIFGELSIEA